MSHFHWGGVGGGSTIATGRRMQHKKKTFAFDPRPARNKEIKTKWNRNEWIFLSQEREAGMVVVVGGGATTPPGSPGGSSVNRCQLLHTKPLESCAERSTRHRRPLSVADVDLIGLDWTGKKNATTTMTGSVSTSSGVGPRSAMRRNSRPSASQRKTHT